MKKTGEFSKRGVERKTYEIIDIEAKIVRKIFDLFTEEGYGGIRIAKYLNEKGYKTHKGNEWSYSTINNMLRNPIYTGFLCFHKTSVPLGGGKRKRVNDWIYSKERIPEIQIISDEQFEKAQKIKQARVNKNKKRQEENKQYFQYQTKGELLFTGYIKCGGCGRMLTSRSSKRKIKNEDGTIGYTKYFYYACMHNFCGEDCKSRQKAHKNNTIETPVINEIYKYFDTLETKDLSDYVRKIQKNNKSNEEKQIKEVDKKLKEYLKKNELLKEEIMKSILGKSSFSKDLLSEIMTENKQKVEEYTKLKKELEILSEQKNVEFEEMVKLKKLIPEWREVFEKATVEQKKMLLSSIIKEVIVYDEKIDVKLRISFNEFINMTKKLNKKNMNCFENICNRGTGIIDTSLGARR